MADETPDSVARAIELLADVFGPARARAAEDLNFTASEPHYTIGYLIGTVGQLLDELGYPETGPDFGPSSRLPTVEQRAAELIAEELAR